MYTRYLSFTDMLGLFRQRREYGAGGAGGSDTELSDLSKHIAINIDTPNTGEGSRINCFECKNVVWSV